MDAELDRYDEVLITVEKLSTGQPYQELLVFTHSSGNNRLCWRYTWYVWCYCRYGSPQEGPTGLPLLQLQVHLLHKQCDGADNSFNTVELGYNEHGYKEHSVITSKFS